ncbi:GNAT family N-acetyltransferase [Bacillus sp. SD088]|uniref:GNAT family N-acetyltransferase n=1 Tax=Bacillus sp. SD088 TaxID=2782012 RepID=UPI001A979C5D|nr:GNAT family protein [Bacillus sp. SD088]MBO0992805.1 GNAT family N-acetyltransferase [Bacillus sp. SD088]
MGITKILAELPTLETERLVLRKIRTEDLGDMHIYGSNDEVSKHVSWNTHQSLSDTKAFLDNILEQYKKNKIAFWGIELKENRKLVGTINYVTISLKHKKAEIGYILSQEFWGKGIMTEATKEIIKFGFEKMNLVRIEAKCIVENTGSQRVMEKAGMIFEGTIRKGMFTKGKHRDLKSYSILEEEFSRKKIEK